MLKIIKKNYLLLLIFLTALFIRLWGTNPGFPPFHPDENMSYSTAIHMFYHLFKTNRFDYPAGVPFLHTLIYQTIFLPLTFLKMFFPHPRVFLTAIKIGNKFLDEFREVIFGSSNLKALFWSRYIAAFIGALCIPLVYWTGKKLFNQRVGLFSAFFLAFNYRHVLGSHFGLPDVHNSFFSLLAFFASVLLLEKNTRKRYLLAGITCGLAFSMKYQIFSFFPFFLVHLIWARRKRSFRYLFHSHFFKALILSFLTFLIINPYFFFNLEEVMKITQWVAKKYAMGINQFLLYSYFYLYHWGIGRLPSLSLVLGALVMFFLARQKFLLIFSFIFSFFFVMTYYSGGGIYPRNFVSVMPFLMLLAGYFLELIYLFLNKIKLVKNRFHHQTVHCLLVTAILIFLNYQNIKNSAILSYYYAQPWNLTVLSDWLKEKLPANTQLSIYKVQINQPVAKALKEKKVKLLDWTYSHGPHSLAEFQEEGTDFVIFDTHRFEGATYWWRRWPSEILFKYDQVPFAYLNSSFYGLSIQELLNYTVQEIYKPWQAASEYNYLIFKIPSPPKALGKKIAFFSFDQQESLWQTRSSFGFKPIITDWDGQVGKTNPGSLVIKGGGEKTSRLASQPIKIQSGKLYTVRGWLKNLSQKEGVPPDGFLRIDFYRGKTETELEKIGLSVALSARTPVSGEWIQKQTSLIAPQGGHYLTISFQRQNPGQDVISYLDDVEVFEADASPEEKFKELPYLQPTIPQESLYPNSFL